MKQRILFIAALLFATMQTFAQTYTYDKLNRLEKVVYENGVTVTYVYDALGNRTSKTVTGASGATYTITVNVSPSGSGSVTGGGTYAANSTVELRAIPNAGYAFSKWSNNKTDNPLSLTVTDNLTLTAYFTESQSDLEGDVNGDGTVDVADIATIIDVMSGVGADPVLARTADVNGDGAVDVADIASVISIMAGGSITPVDDRQLVASSEVDGTKYAVYIKQDKDDVRYNADHTPYYRTTITLDATKNGKTTTYTVDDGPYNSVDYYSQIRSMCINKVTNQIFIFANSSLGYNYALDGYCYVASLSDLSFQKETVFSKSNYGWWSYFSYDSGVLRLNHFSFAGYYAMMSTRNSDGTWTTEQGGYIRPDDFIAQSEQAERVLIVDITPDNDRQLVVSSEVDGTEYAVYIKQDNDDVRYNADHTPYYRTTITLDATKNGKTTTYTVDDGPYNSVDYYSQIRSMCINKVTNQIFIFANSSLGYNYALDGYCYVASLSDLSFQKETVFSESNYGWWSYFSYDSGVLRLNHFSFAGYYAMMSTRNSDGTWTTERGGDIRPDDFIAQSEQAGRVLIVDGSND